MNCEICQAKLSPYLERELSAEETRALEQHLSGCSHCAAELESLRRVVSGLKGMPPPRVPENFRQAVWAKIDAKSWRGAVASGAASTSVRTKRMHSSMSSSR